MAGDVRGDWRDDGRGDGWDVDEDLGVTSPKWPVRNGVSGGVMGVASVEANFEAYSRYENIKCALYS